MCITAWVLFLVVLTITFICYDTSVLTEVIAQICEHAQRTMFFIVSQSCSQIWSINWEYNEYHFITNRNSPLTKWMLIFSWLHTYILCLSLFLGLPIGFAYRRLIWSAFLCSSFFPFSFGLQTWQTQVPGGCPNTQEYRLSGFINSEDVQYIHLKHFL